MTCPSTKFLRLCALAVALALPAWADPVTNNFPDVALPELSPRPVAEAGVATPLLSLNGTWKFSTNPPSGFEQFAAPETKSWSDIAVPGEWVMQGFAVASNTAAAYWHEFTVPADWSGRCLKLRFDCVHSDCTVYVNGQRIGAHEGCFTVFELDVTDAVKPGRNVLALAVKSESTADTLDSATQYAAHQLGGITRKVQLFALPTVHLAEQVITADYDAATTNGFLTAKLHLSPVTRDPLTVRLRLLAPGSSKSAAVTEITADGEYLSPKLNISRAESWDPEHPRLYTLLTELIGQHGEVLEQTSQRLGFRRIEIRGNQLFVNNAPVKLRGSCRHEVDPLRGRSLTPELWRKDAELFRAANVNYIRTSHYPPAEEFLDLCDEYGFFVECEAPLCWVEHGANSVWQNWNYQDAKFFPYLLRANYENLAANRNHPCVTIWSLANESRWSPLFAEVNLRVKAADPTRPTSFHDQCWGGYNNANSQADIAVYHYPGENGPAKCDEEKRPVLFGEYCHVECYNRRELVTDPGVRDDWGRGFARMNDLMYQHDGCLGGAIWAGIDDVFCLPDGKFVGYGMWGAICDGWRRDKPETWHVKNAYSPVRVTVRELPVPAPGETIRIPVLNRYNFANLNELKITWSFPGSSGKLTANIPARHEGELILALKKNVKNGDVLNLSFTDPRGFVCDEENLTFGHPVEPTVSAPSSSGALTITESPETIQVKGDAVEYVIDRKSGQFIRAAVRNKTILTGGPALMILPLQTEACEPVDLGVWKPLNNVCENWQADSVQAHPMADGAVEIVVKGSCTDADGGYTLHLDAGGKVQLHYAFKSRVSENPRQWGMVFFTPKNFDTLAWNRQAQWTAYPANHIGRPAGTAHAHVAAVSQPYATQKPKSEWSLDATILGGNDFTSTKRGILQAALGSSHESLAIVSDGHQSIRAFVAGEQAGLLVAGFHTGGGDGFFGTHFATERRPLQIGTPLADTINLQLSAKGPHL